MDAPPKVRMSPADLHQALTTGAWYPTCPNCRERTPAEPDATAPYCVVCNQRIRIENPSKFTLGQLVMTPGVFKAIAQAGQDPMGFILRHATGDWGELGEEDKAENELSLAHGFRLLSAYRTTKGVKLWVIAEADRSATTILLPEEY